MQVYQRKMTKKNIATQNGFTLIELAVAMVIVAFIILGVGFVVADSQRQWGVMYNLAYSDVAADSYVATKTFETVVRKASGQKFMLSNDGGWIEVCYPADASSSGVADRYARFSYEAGEGDSKGRLLVEYGRLNPREALTASVICENVSGCVFKANGRSAQMVLILNDDSQTITVVSSAYMHNQ